MYQDIDSKPSAFQMTRRSLHIADAEHFTDMFNRIQSFSVQLQDKRFATKSVDLHVNESYCEIWHFLLSRRVRQ